jgi:regulator of sigma E protease
MAAWQGTPAAAARKAFPFQPGDRIVAITNPDKPGELVELPKVPAGDEKAEAEYTFQLAQRWQRLAGKEMKVRILRKGGKEETLALEPGRFEFGDTVIAATDPRHPGEVTAIPPDPRNPDKSKGDFYEFQRRQRLLAGQFMTIRVRRANKQEVDLVVPPAYHQTLPGVRMRMGQVAALRDGSEGGKAGLHAGDILKEVVLSDSQGKQQHFVFAQASPNAASDQEVVDPLRLPLALRRWAEKHEGVKAAFVVVRDKDEKLAHEETLGPVAWDNDPRWQFDQELPLGVRSPLAIPELGVAYRVEAIVEDAGPAVASEGLQKNDVIKGYRVGASPEPTWLQKNAPAVYLALGAVVLLLLGAFAVTRNQRFLVSASLALVCVVIVWMMTLRGERWTELEPDGWARAALLQLMQPQDAQKVTLRVERSHTLTEVPLSFQPDPTWPLADRGVKFTVDTQTQVAANLGDAVGLGLQDTWATIVDVYWNLIGMFTTRLSWKNVGGPLTIGVMAYRYAGMGFWEFVFFMGAISVNLAVINFLPIPFLDGGHMAFLIYEKLRGRPAPESVQNAANLTGVLFLLALMAWVIGYDVWRFFFS